MYNSVMDKKQRISIWYFLIAFWLLIIFQEVYLASQHLDEVPYSQFKIWLAEDKVDEIAITDTEINGKLKPETPDKEPQWFKTIRVDDPNLVKQLEEKGVEYAGVIVSTLWRDVASWVIPILIFAGVWFWLLRKMGQGAGGGFMRIGQSKAKIYVEKDIKVKMSDVAGVDEAKDELVEVIEFLKTPQKFTRIGGRIPKGVLLVGPPGTGKTLLAKAIAGESGVTFFSISGSEFVEMFVGVGAARVRDLFEQAKGKAPCIIFIDELDALGKARGTGPMTHEEREQTLNQLLVEMDGFDPKVGVIILAATNRPEILDPALMRAGRFDRQVLVDRPDRKGREAILKIHSKIIQMGPDVKLENIAAMTPGMVGADLANIINEGALLAVRRDREIVEQRDLEEAVERVVAGLEKKNRILSQEERRRVAHHEIGHALVALSLKGVDPVQKISIIPRGIAALGYTLQTPTEDRYLLTRSELENKIAVLLGGRIAEEIVFGEASTGAADDLQKATNIAKRMVKDYGMSDLLGTVSLENAAQPTFLQTRESSYGHEYSEETAREIDQEVRKFIDNQANRVKDLLTELKPVLLEAAQVLMTKETMTGDDLRALMEGREKGAGLQTI
ncbi:ATP-dependent zinc metalloprotease FtsH [Candidatus Nitronereus thalassa]|uniref:ATP-dependent zinc metalloprotease FtsH n=2 Tax=Candidatus Nitronereus thalassa TaxID=3020898 RepID=A0ABU3K997_9BACT|nr:ATP-dependent zinc metalloprotease FtsH [Candidatus Nitronereus thalassa]MDT7042878.1 ATP-dependent zinc metalloprotease FtsH [Candidatus Nitronereus thalassa]